MATIARIHSIISVARHRDATFQAALYQSDKLIACGLTSGDVVRFKVWTTADAAPAIDIDSIALSSATFTADHATDTLTSAAHGLANGDRVVLSGTLPTGLLTTRYYYVVSTATNTFKLSLTSGGSAIDFSSNGSGTLTWTKHYSTIVIDDLGTTGSTAAQLRIKLKRDEVDLLTAGEWNWELSVVMVSNNSEIYVIATGLFSITDNATGDLVTT